MTDKRGFNILESPSDAVELVDFIVAAGATDVTQVRCALADSSFEAHRVLDDLEATAPAGGRLSLDARGHAAWSLVAP